MKTFIVTAAILLSVITASAQQIKSTMEERLTKYIPVLKPRPCSVFLVDYTATEGTVKDWAQKLGLKPLETMYPNDTTQYILQYFDPENPSIIYGFIHKKKSRTYIGAFVFIKFKDHFSAIERLDDLKSQLYFNWGNDDKEKTSASSKCQSDGTDRFISVRRTNDILMITTMSLTLLNE